VDRSIIGAVIGITEPTTLKFIVDVDKTKDKPLEIGEYVSIEFNDRFAIGMVTLIYRENQEIIPSLINSPETVQRMRSLASSSDVILAKVSIQGFVEQSGKLFKPRFPTLPGSSVYRNPNEELKVALGNGQITIGKLRGNPQIPVTLNVNRLISRHFCVIAVTGAGKSYALGVILDQMLTTYPSTSIVVIDPHQDYFYFKEDPKFSDRVELFTPDGQLGTNRLRFKVSNIRLESLMEIIGIPSNATKQQTLLTTIIQQLETGTIRDWGLHSISDQLDQMIAAEETSASDREVAVGLRRRFRYIPESAFLDPAVETPVASTQEVALTSPGKLSIISTGLLESKGREAMVHHVLHRIFHGAIGWRRNSGKNRLLGPVLIIIEEAHQFAPPKDTNCKQIIQQIAGEGRKFGVGLGIVSQRPGKLDENVLSQCNTQVILRITNPKDQSAISNASETMSQDLMHDLPGLNIGEAIITGSAIGIPAMVKITERHEISTGGDDVDINEFWKKRLPVPTSIPEVSSSLEDLL
jgi:uncharacterized protein